MASAAMHQTSLYLAKRLKTHPDNNIAERGIRPAVVMRKNSYGNRSDKGAGTTSVMLSVMETCDMKGQNFLDWGTDYLKR